MNEFQKRALAYNAYRALRKLAAASKQTGTTSLSMAAGEKTPGTNENSGNKNQAPKSNSGYGRFRGTQWDHYRAFPKKVSSTGKGKKGCC